MQKLDYRCTGNYCLQAMKCRRFLTWPESKNSPVPFAAFDMRDTVECDGFMVRHSLDEFAVETEGGV
jgi:hypothetical protein